MLLGVVSDTHGHLANAQAAARLLASFNVNAVVHCGDICSSSIAEIFAPWPATYVLGNCDEDTAELRESIEVSGGTYAGRFADLTIASRRIALIHSDDARRFRQAIRSGEYDLVCYGHTHQAEQHYEGKTLVLNPGALYRANPHSIAIVDLVEMKATIVSV